ncbi:MAG TPA: hypothetical protein VES66_06580 [Terriglobales bacterium]|nr:hypothetical protein [Terriglobales bacterium]
MRHARIYRKALFIDQFVDSYKKVRGTRHFPHKAVKTIIHLIFPSSSVSGRGAFKTVHKISSRARDLVLKTANPQHVKSDIQAYNRLPANIRNRYFAKIYWSTKYCLLQRYGKRRKVPPLELQRLQTVAKTHGLRDAREANVRFVDKLFKIVDASVR